MKMEQKGDTLVITLDVSEAARKAAQPSGSGKTLIVASSHGFARVGDVAISLNATIANPNYKAK